MAATSSSLVVIPSSPLELPSPSQLFLRGGIGARLEDQHKSLEAPDARLVKAPIKTTKQNGGHGPTEKAKSTKRKSKILVDEGQSRIVKNKISKPSCSSNRTDVAAALSSDWDQPLGLEKVIARKRDWTPVKNRTTNGAAKENTSPCGSDYTVLDMAIDSCDFSSSSSRAIFDSLGGKFSYGGPIKEQGSVSRSKALLSTSTKRRKVDLVDGLTCHSAHINPVPAKRTKAPKKKAQTITEKATEPFMPKVAKADSSLLELFCASQSAPNRVQDETTEKATSKKATAKPPSKKKSRQDKLAAVPKLSTPEEAMRCLQNQDLLFGTSSQLVREESPTMVRDLQQALKNSQSDLEEGKDSSFHSLTEFDSGLEALSRSRSAVSSSAKRLLWSVAARDSQGSVLDKEEFVDLCSTPGTTSALGFTPSRSLWAVSPLSGFGSAVQGKAKDEVVRSTKEIITNGADERPVLTDDTAAPPAAAPPMFSLPRSMAECALKDRPKPKDKPKPKSKSKGQAKDLLAATTTTATIPDPPPPAGKKTATKSKSKAAHPPPPSCFDDYTDAMLKKAVADFGFKPSTSRKKMMGILERCWASKRGNGDVGDADSVASALPQPQPLSEAPVKKPRGRPAGKKNASSTATATATTTASTIASTTASITASTTAASSNAPITTSTACPFFSTALPPPTTTDSLPTTTTTTSTTSITSTINPNSDSNPLHPAISLAIRTQPPTHSASSPSFAEQIALYDPIVLEELTVWLNSAEGLGRVGVDEEVAPSLVREWCEARSVCCVWRVNLRGRARR